MCGSAVKMLIWRMMELLAKSIDSSRINGSIDNIIFGLFMMVAPKERAFGYSGTNGWSFSRKVGETKCHCGEWLVERKWLNEVRGHWN